MDYYRKDVAKIMRRDLKTAFPNTQFSVRCKSWSMGGEIRVEWTDGPTKDDVESLVGKYQDRGFDGMIDMSYHYDHWLLPNGTIELAGTGGTTGSMGTVEPWETDKPHPDAVKVSLHTGYVSCDRYLSDAFLANIRNAFAQLTEDERSALMDRTHATRCLSPFEMPDRWHLDADLSDFGVNAERVFNHMAYAIAA